MNKIITNVLFMIIAVVIIVVLGNLFFISNLDNKILQLELDIAEQRNKVENQKSEIENLSSEKTDSNAPRVLSIGEEGKIMKHFLDSDKFKSPLVINTYDLFASYFYKPENTDENDNNAANQQNKNNSENTPLLDDNGMPVNAYAETDSEWNGIEILPIKITFSQKPEDMGKTLKLLNSLPVNAVRTADFVFGKKFIRGTMILAFPLNEE
jgi:hypothetical protein